jgi:RNA polymerase primary sigma factor
MSGGIMHLRLRDILKMDWTHVKNRAFYARNVETKIFDPDKVRFDAKAVAATWNTIFVSCPSGMALQKFTFKSNEEKIMFLRFNFARMKTARAIEQLLRAHKIDFKQIELDCLPHKVAISKELSDVMKWAKTTLEIRNAIIVANLGLIISVLKKKFGLSIIDAPDSVSMGIASLIRAIEKFDVSKGFKFSTYAFRAIINSVKRGYLDQQKHPSGIPIGNGEGEIIVADKQNHSERVDDLDTIDHLYNVLNENLAGLNAHEEHVIRARFFGNKTLQDIGDEIKLSKERIRQLQNIALKKLHNVMKDCPVMQESNIPMFEPELLKKAS